MQDFFRFLETAAVCVTVWFLAMTAALSLPQSELRDFVVKSLRFVWPALCGAYVLSPIDFLPEALLGPVGLVDDLAAGALGVRALLGAVKEFRQS